MIETKFKKRFQDDPVGIRIVTGSFPVLGKF